MPRAAEVHAIAAAVAARAERHAGSPLPTGIPRGWRNVGPAMQPVHYRTGGRDLDVQLDPVVTVDGRVCDVAVLGVGATAVDLEVDGVRHAVRVHRVQPTVYVDSALGSSSLDELTRFPLPERADAPGSLLAPLPGSVVHVSVALGDTVRAGEALVALEAMKMEHTVRAPHDGVVTEVLGGAGGSGRDGCRPRRRRPERRAGSRSGTRVTAVRYEVVRGVAWVTIDRAEARNALSAEVRAGLLDATRAFNADDGARVLVLTGAGDQAFCAGGDLKEMAATELRVPPPDFVPQFGRTIDGGEAHDRGGERRRIRGRVPPGAHVRPLRGRRPCPVRDHRGEGRSRGAMGRAPLPRHRAGPGRDAAPAHR